MSGKNKTLPLDGCANLVTQLMNDFVRLSKTRGPLPKQCTYKIASSVEPGCILRSARKAAFLRVVESFPIKKYAFDTRKIDQGHERNPRTNLQYWSRSQQYIDEEDQKRLESFACLVEPLDAIKEAYGDQPEYFESFARSLHDSVKRVLKVNESDLDIFRPQLDYLEQLLYARYRVSLDDLSKLGSERLKEKILSKDEDLLKRGSFLNATTLGDNQKKANIVMTKDGKSIDSQNLINALFNVKRKSGEKKIQRTVTITITDGVIE